MNTVLSLFPGVGLLDRAFESCGFCVVRGPDPLWGGDVRNFNPPAGLADGVIGGSPCQDFSAARRDPPTGQGVEMLGEFERVVRAVRPEWWLLENVPAVPDVKIDGYSWQRFDINLAWFTGVRRLRHIQFGSWSGKTLSVDRGVTDKSDDPTALASQGTLEDVKRKQGLPDSFDLPGFTRDAARRAIGNGVPQVLGVYLATAIRTAYGLPCDVRPPKVIADKRNPTGVCSCQCGRPIYGRQKYASDACRKRVSRR